MPERRLPKRALALLALVACVGALAACGDSPSSESGGRSATSKNVQPGGGLRPGVKPGPDEREFLNSATAACGEVLGALGPLPTGSRARDLEARANALVPAMAKLSDRLRRMKPPASLRTLQQVLVQGYARVGDVYSRIIQLEQGGPGKASAVRALAADARAAEQDAAGRALSGGVPPCALALR